MSGFGWFPASGESDYGFLLARGAPNADGSASFRPKTTASMASASSTENSSGSQYFPKQSSKNQSGDLKSISQIVSRFSVVALGCVELTITPACVQSGLSG
jgi:hypothetical protein